MVCYTPAMQAVTLNDIVFLLALSVAYFLIRSKLRPNESLLSAGSLNGYAISLVVSGLLMYLLAS